MLFNNFRGTKVEKKKEISQKKCCYLPKFSDFSNLLRTNQAISRLLEL
jgi:hypothetical protein